MPVLLSLLDTDLCGMMLYDIRFMNETVIYEVYRIVKDDERNAWGEARVPYHLGQVQHPPQTARQRRLLLLRRHFYQRSYGCTLFGSADNVSGLAG